jgi:acetophenone carboxylase
MVENEMLPPGHPVTHDIELDIDKLKEKYLASKTGGAGNKQ